MVGLIGFATGVVGCHHQLRQDIVLFAANDPDKEITATDFDFLGEQYAEFWKISDATQNSFNWSFGNVIFQLKEGQTINDLLKTAEKIDQRSFSVLITDQEKFPHVRAALTHDGWRGDYALYYYDQSKQMLDFDENKHDRWLVTMRIPVSQIDLDKLEIPATLKINYTNPLQAMIDFHNNRGIDEDQPAPTTHRQYRDSLNLGTFGDEEAED